MNKGFHFIPSYLYRAGAICRAVKALVV